MRCCWNWAWSTVLGPAGLGPEGWVAGLADAGPGPALTGMAAPGAGMAAVRAVGRITRSATPRSRRMVAPTLIGGPPSCGRVLIALESPGFETTC